MGQPHFWSFRQKGSIRKLKIPEMKRRTKRVWPSASTVTVPIKASKTST
jgi:predicted RNA binding protein YcfA (HicA-like mRNA interferase family)